jgi:hypothetical protein
MLLNHFISFTWAQRVMLQSSEGSVLCGSFWTCHVFAALSLAKTFGRFQTQPSQNQGCCLRSQHTKHGTAAMNHFISSTQAQRVILKY